MLTIHTRMDGRTIQRSSVVSVTHISRNLSALALMSGKARGSGTGEGLAPSDYVMYHEQPTVIWRCDTCGTARYEKLWQAKRHKMCAKCSRRKGGQKVGSTFGKRALRKHWEDVTFLCWKCDTSMYWHWPRDKGNSKPITLIVECPACSKRYEVKVSTV